VCVCVCACYVKMYPSPQFPENPR